MSNWGGNVNHSRMPETVYSDYAPVEGGAGSLEVQAASPTAPRPHDSADSHLCLSGMPHGQQTKSASFPTAMTGFARWVEASP